MDVPEVEVRLEAVGVETDRPLVEGLGFDHLVARVVNVGQVDDRRHQIGIDHERLPVRRGRSLHVPIFAVVEA